jgi:hypothetical protein
VPPRRRAVRALKRLCIQIESDRVHAADPRGRCNAPQRAQGDGRVRLGDRLPAIYPALTGSGKG